MLGGRPTSALALALVVVLAGCSGLVPTATPSPAFGDSPDVAVVDGVDRDGDGAVSSFAVEVTADTRLPAADGSGPGEPYVLVKVENEPVAVTGVLDRAASTTVTVAVGAATLHRFSAGTLSVTVLLFDAESTTDDVVRSWTGTVTYEPRADEPTATVPPTTGGGTATSRPMAERTEFAVRVVEVVDGDTVAVRFPDGHVENVRLLGVDTPEIHAETDPAEWEGVPENETGRDHLRRWSHRASEFAGAELRPGERVRIVVDETADRRGSYGRLLVYLYDDGSLFNLALLRQGYARFYDTSFRMREGFRSVEANARANRVGIWNLGAGTVWLPESPGTPTPTAAGNVSLSVVEIHPDARGNDHANPNDEYVVLRNTGEETLDLSGWRVEDGAGHSYRFPAGATLAPGEEVTLHTGDGTDTATHRYWGADAAVWNNGGDVIRVLDRDGRVVLRRRYG